MADKFDKKTRSKIMSKIRAKNTKAEILLRKALWKNGLRGYRLHYDLPGKPDILFPKNKLVIFIDGDFWHGYTWKVLGKIPLPGYWQEKINKNILRDKKINAFYKEKEWPLIRFWEHEIKENISLCVTKIKEILDCKEYGSCY